MAKKIKSNKKVNDGFMLSENKETKLMVVVTAKNAGQKQALKAISENQVTFLYGSPGTGKSHCAVGWGIQEMLRGHFDRVIFTRPYVEAGEKLGFLPGNFDNKFAPFAMPLYEVVSEYLSTNDIKNLIDAKKIVIYPLAYMRGCTFKNAYVVADEMQNTTKKQMRMLLTRIGEGSKIVCTGDTEQSDLGNAINGLSDAIDRLDGIDKLAFVKLDYASCVREKIVSDIDRRYHDVENTFKQSVEYVDLLKRREEILKNGCDPSLNGNGVHHNNGDSV